MAESNPFMRISYRACRLRRRLVASSRRSAPRLLANDADLGLCRDLRGEAEEPGPGGAVAEGAAAEEVEHAPGSGRVCARR